MKRFVILKSSGGELANQLWNYVSIYAYGLETGARIQNPSFFEYHAFFNFLPNESLATKCLTLFFTKVRRRAHPINRFWRKGYALWSKTVVHFHPAIVVSSENTSNKVFYLPPTTEIVLPHSPTLYFSGWLFRNPTGLEKYRDKLIAAFSPKAAVQQKVKDIISRLKQKKKVLIGVHIRQGDYKVFKDGRYLISAKRMREVLDEYIATQDLHPNDIALLITSDGAIDLSIFAGFETYHSQENAVTDLFLLSCTDTIIGSNSSFGNFAAWYGNVPHIVATKEQVDWEYYQGKSAYFPNKYATLMQW
jgi:hypothetical protein